MKQRRPVIEGSGEVADMHHLRLMSLLQELVRTWGYTGTARVLEIDPRTVTSSVQSGQLTHRVRESLQRALQHGAGSAADRQRERSDKLEGQLKENLRSGLKVLNRLETRLDKTEGQVKDMKGDRRTGLKGLRMSLPGKLTDPTLAELVDAGERTNGVVEWDTSAPPGGGDEKADAPSEPGIPGPTRVSRRNLACSQEAKDHLSEVG